MLILQWFVHSSFYPGRSLDSRGLLGSLGQGFGCRVVPRSCLGKRRVACMRVRPDSHARCAVVVGHAQVTPYLTRRRLVDQSMSRRSRRVPLDSRQHRFPICIE